MNMNKLILMILLLQPTMMNPAHAAKMAKVVVESARVLDKPQSDATEISKIPKDTTIPVSNNQTNGYYKTKISSGQLGWISGADILAGETIGAPAASVKEEKKTEKKSEASASLNQLVLSGGLNLVSNTGFPSKISTTDAGKAYAGTLELQFGLNDRFSLSGRVEYISSSSSQTITGGTQAFKFKTIPILGGVNYFPLHKNKFKWGFGAYGGLSMLTSLTVTQTTSVNNPEFSSTDFTAYFNTQAMYAFSSAISGLLEVGYRMHSASYPAFSSYPTVAFTPNFGGLVTRLGVSFGI